MLSILFQQKKNTKLVKPSKIITEQPKTLENPNIADKKSSFIEYSKSSCKLFNTIKQAEKLSLASCANKNSSKFNALYIVKEKKLKFWQNYDNEKCKRKIIKCL